MNYFELFALPIAPAVDKKLLSATYFELQRKNHPDFFTQASETEQDEALKRSADINKAFAVFQDNQRTIEYFLQVKGSIGEDEKYNLPADFLMEMMEMNEGLEGKDARDAEKEIAAYEQSFYNEIKHVLEPSGGATINEAGLEKLKEYYYKKKYLNRILDRLGD